MALALGAALSRRFVATGAIVIANLAIFLLTLFGPGATVLHTPSGDQPLPLGHPFTAVQADLALYPPNLLELLPIGVLQTFTSMFVHADIWHIAVNMIFLWAFGMPFEERIGARRFVLIYLVSGVVGALAQVAAGVLTGDSPVPMLGASGAVFGIMCAFAAKYPNQVIGVPVPVILILIRIPMRVLYGALIYVALEVVQIVALVRMGGSTNVGHFAHLFGGAAGILLALTLLRHVLAAGKKGPIAIDLVALGDFARDAPTKDVLAHMRQNHDEPEVFQAWLDRFFRTATCPTCSHRVMPKHRGEVVCTQGHSFDVRQDKRAKLAGGAASTP